MAFITNDQEIKKANSSVTIDLSIESLRSFLADAEDRFMKLIGVLPFQELEVKEDTDAHKKMKSAIVNLALFYYADSGQLLISDSGMHVSKSTNLLPASDKKIVSFKKGVSEKAWADFETCVFLMETQKAEFIVWHAGEDRKRYLCSFINDSSTFNFHSSIRVTPQLFQDIRSEIKRVERDSLLPVLGEDLTDELLAKYIADGAEPISPIFKKLHRRICDVIAPLALAGAIPYQVIDFSSKGIFQRSLSAQSDNIEVESTANTRSLQRVMNRLISTGEAELESLRIWMNENISEFQGYKKQAIAPMAEINKGLEDTGFYFM